MSRIASHVEWMADADRITFTTPAHQGVGASFVCRTKIGPFTTDDRMTVTEWVPGKTIGIRHEGLFTGSGRFTLKKSGRGNTRFTWTERVRFPLWLGGPAGALAARPILRHVWRANLRRLAARF